MSDLRDRLNALLIAKFALEPGFAVEPGTLAADPTLMSLGFDSLAIVKLVMAMDGEFGVELDEEELMSEHTSVGDIVELLEDRLSAQRG
jgi:acyl carrier protein